jgi:hypothetical protein
MPCCTELRALRYLNSALVRRRSLRRINSLQYSSRSCAIHLPAYLIVLTVFVLLESTLFAQAPESAVRGIVSDSTGAIVRNANVRVHQPQTGNNRVTQTDDVGQYQVSNLEPDDYEIEAAAPSFKTQVQRIALRVGDNLTVNFRLQPGLVSERVAVNGQASGLNTTDFSVNGSVNQVQIQNLPLNGRNFLALARLEPGVTVISVVNPGTFANNYQRVSMAGSQYVLTQVTVDGVTVDDRINGGTAQNFPQETVQEFQVERFSFDPSSAMSGTGGINIVSRRGNNDIHGATFFYYRDHNMAAYPGFRRDPSHPDPYFARKQSGFRVGGPLKKDRIFWFTNFEHNRQTAAVAIQNNHPIFTKLDVIYPSPNL